MATPRRSTWDRDIGVALARVEAACDRGARRAQDPVDLVHRYRDPLEQELVAVVAASVAFGNVRAIQVKLGEILDRLGPSPLRTSDDPALVKRRLRGFRHRVFRGEDIACLVLGGRRAQVRHGTLGRLFQGAFDRATAAGDDDPLRAALITFVDEIRALGGFPSDPSRRGPRHLLPDPRGRSAMKRLVLFLRWMVRPADGVDLGLWTLSPEHLLIPVDVHIERIGRNLGFTREKTATWKAAREITAGLRRYAPRDPAGYDFALCHLGMQTRCRERRDPVCESCAMRPVCRHWRPCG